MVHKVTDGEGQTLMVIRRVAVPVLQKMMCADIDWVLCSESSHIASSESLNLLDGTEM
jgi:hypothetical protein